MGQEKHLAAGTRRIAPFCFASAVFFSAPALAQDDRPTPVDVCTSASSPKSGGSPLMPGDRLDVIAHALETVQSAKALLLAPEPLQAAQWCLVEDSAGRPSVMNRWYNTAAGPGGALVDRLMNLKGNTKIYLIRVAEGSTTVVDASGQPLTNANYAAIIDEPDVLVVAGYFTGRPSTEMLLANMMVRARITKADGKYSINAPK